MDANTFDSLARRLASPTSRRQALGATLAGGLLSALGLGRSLPEDRADQRDVCTLSFVAKVRLGPNTEQVMTDGGRPGELRGDLAFTLSNSGNLDDATLLLPDGTTFPVVGQATGHSLQLRIALGDELALVAVGVGEQEIASCAGAIDGLTTGPSIGDIGDWHSTAQARPVNGVGVEVGGSSKSGAKKDAPADKPRKKDAAAKPAAPTPTSVPAGSSCAAGLTLCGNVCADLRSDLNNCGACFAVCESGLVPVECRGGVCERANCPVGITYCGALDGCRDLSSDSGHCGACQNACPTNSCSDGVCGGGIQNCVPPFAVCGDACVDLRGNPGHCGSCDNRCPDLLCQDGVCIDDSDVGRCPGSQINCAGMCIDPSSDDANCGICGNDCYLLGFDYSCEGGSCVQAQCPAGTTDCGGYCADLLTSTVHCGACGIACGTGQPCQGGACATAPACAPGLTNCFGVCLDLASDPDNCGECGVGCVSGICVGATCTMPTAPTCAAQGLSDCGGICVDLLSDASNCGACGVACPQGPGSCIGGFCPA